MTLLAPPGDGRPAGEAVGTTVVVAAHQAGATLRRCLDSVLGQVPAPTEVVVVDDGSTDDTQGVLLSYGDRVRTVRHGTNQGEAAAKNAGVRAARTPLAALIDADDVALPGWLAAVSGALSARPDLDVVTADAWVVVGGRRVRRAYAHGGSAGMVFPVHDQRREILRRNFVLGVAAFRRDAMLAAGGFDERSPVASDWSAWARMVLAGSRVGLVAEPLAEYHLLADSLSADRLRLLAARVDVLSRLGDDPHLTADDGAVLDASLREHRAVLELAQAREAVARGAADARGRARAVAASRRHPPATRAKAAATAVLPLALSRWLVSRRGPQESLRTSV